MTEPMRCIPGGPMNPNGHEEFAESSGFLIIKPAIVDLDSCDGAENEASKSFSMIESSRSIQTIGDGAENEPSKSNSVIESSRSIQTIDAENIAEQLVHAGRHGFDLPNSDYSTNMGSLQGEDHMQLKKKISSLEDAIATMEQEIKKISSLENVIAMMEQEIKGYHDREDEYLQKISLLQSGKSRQDLKRAQAMEEETRKKFAMVDAQNIWLELENKGLTRRVEDLNHVIEKYREQEEESLKRAQTMEEETRKKFAMVDARNIWLEQENKGLTHRLEDLNHVIEKYREQEEESLKEYKIQEDANHVMKEEIRALGKKIHILEEEKLKLIMKEQVHNQKIKTLEEENGNLKKKDQSIQILEEENQKLKKKDQETKILKEENQDLQKDQVLFQVRKWCQIFTTSKQILLFLFHVTPFLIACCLGLPPTTGFPVQLLLAYVLALFYYFIVHIIWRILVYIILLISYKLGLLMFLSRIASRYFR